MINVLFVCMGNICRSPTAEAVFNQVVDEAGLSEKIYTESAGTHGYHVGHPPDERTQAVAKQFGVDMSSLRSRQVVMSDFKAFEYIVAMAEDNLEHLKMIAPKTALKQLSLLLEYHPNPPVNSVPDPYYGGDKGFEEVFELVKVGTTGLLEAICQKEKLD